MEPNYEACYEIDMVSGLSVSGIVYSEATFDGKTTSQIVVRAEIGVLNW